MNLLLCTEEHLDLLVHMNKQLIEDERHDNPMTLQELKERMRMFISTSYKAFIFQKDGQVIGYALVDMTRKPLYLRQFFIDRGCRRKGFGATAFHLLLEELKTDTIDIEVLSWNEAGIGFWKSLGFKERSIYMRYERKPGES
ncbi:MAG: GNAT family N-acetyltransferase [Firmicutes bacterium]|nr:GNAT family N-acetyltransferase [Bacillota bacterium]